MIPAGLRRWLGGGSTGIKFCGFTREEDALAAVGAGADALGFNFYEKSKRRVQLDAVSAWIGRLPEDVGRVAVVVQPDEGLLRALQDSGLFHAVQFHGALAAIADPAPCLLLDAHAPGEFGGTGRTIDWSLAARVVREAGRPVVLSGGLHADNVAGAMAAVHPVAVDTASGVESAPGIKDAAKMKAFVEAVRGQPG
jgi:phosphoribosylanthranilate isomerase